MKSLNHGRKILELEKPIADWFIGVICYSGLIDLCFVVYMNINHNIKAAFTDRRDDHHPRRRPMPLASFYQGKITKP